AICFLRVNLPFATPRASLPSNRQIIHELKNNPPRVHIRSHTIPKTGASPESNAVITFGASLDSPRYQPTIHRLKNNILNQSVLHGIMRRRHGPSSTDNRGGCGVTNISLNAAPPRKIRSPTHKAKFLVMQQFFFCRRRRGEVSANRGVAALPRAAKG